MNEKISERHARSLLKLTDKLKQVELLNKIINERWTVKRLDDEIQDILSSYQNNKNITGEVHANSQLDVNVNNILNNSSDIGTSNEVNYSYTNDFSNKTSEKKSLIFNNLENESVNMNPEASIGFNPFKTSGVSTNPLLNELDVIDIDEEEDNESKPQETQKNMAYGEPIVETTDEIENELKKIIKLANKKTQKVRFEEFDFGDIYQIVIKVDKKVH